jgi:hypothetical protein
LEAQLEALRDAVFGVAWLAFSRPPSRAGLTLLAGGAAR